MLKKNISSLTAFYGYMSENHHIMILYVLI